MARPCENCPYRLDARRQLWHRSEFEKLLESERDPLGRIFNCHKQARLPAPERGFCAGWLLDQKKRGVPSIALRLELMKPEALKAFERVSGAGLRLFRSLYTMCRANGVAAQEPPKDPWMARLRAARKAAR